MQMSKASSAAAASGSRSNHQKQHVPIAVPEEITLDPHEVQAFIDHLKNQVAFDHTVYVKKRIEENDLKLADATRNSYNLSTERKTQQNTSTEGSASLLICSDSEEDAVEEEEMIEFAESEDYILRMVVQKFGLSDLGLDLLAHCFSKKPDDIKARYEDLTKDENDIVGGGIDSSGISFLDKNVDVALNSFDNLFCRRCLIFNCQLHGCSRKLIFPTEKQSQWCPPEAIKDPCGRNCYRVVFNQDGSTIGKSKEHGNDALQVPKMKHTESSTSIRSKSSRKENLIEKSNAVNEAKEDESWRPLEKSLYESGLEIFGKSSCLIARNTLSGQKTCAEIFKYMNSLENQHFSQEGNGSKADADGYTRADGSEAMGKGVRRKSRFVQKIGKVRRLKCTSKSPGFPSFCKRISDRKDQPCRQYNPCGCKSSCGNECPCHVNGNCCEKYCGCPMGCKNRYRGCQCAKSQCRGPQCPCFATDRECDPDVCRNCWISCGDGSMENPFGKGDNYECNNMKILLKQHQKVLLGKSDVSGWGVFLKNSVEKHEYIGEYTGELISHAEADKRGKIYDRVNSSFLFNLNDQFVVDAYRKGNKLKFVNHSSDPNCYAKVILVAGDHRVGIFAKKRIGAGEELFYDYRYDVDRAPVWAMNPEASGSKKDEVGPEASGSKKDEVGLGPGSSSDSNSDSDSGPSLGRAKKHT